MKDEDQSRRPDWGKLLQEALNTPGVLSDCYSVFYNYSLGNQMLAASQMLSRGMGISPIATFKKWKSLGRSVKKGEKAISLYMPVTVRKKEAESEDEDARFQFFVMKPRWFALSQTDGEYFDAPSVIPDWNKYIALEKLGLSEIPFQAIDGNIQGYARPNKKEVAINPVAAYPMKTLFHEIAHCVLHSKEAMMADGAIMERGQKEAEAESVAYLCCATLGLDGKDESRAYIQDWLDGDDKDEFAKKSASRVFSAADKILRAGRRECLEPGSTGDEDNAA